MAVCADGSSFDLLGNKQLCYSRKLFSAEPHEPSLFSVRETPARSQIRRQRFLRVPLLKELTWFLVLGFMLGGGIWVVGSGHCSLG